METAISYKPRASSGWIWLVLFGCVILLLTNIASLSTGFSFTNPVIAFVGLIGLVFFLVAMGLAIIFPHMHYDLRGDHLALMYGPFQLYRIPYQSIRKVSWQDLAVSPVSAIRMPGLALFSVPYSDAGVVKMCATSAATRILMIHTANGVYGITPAEEQSFVESLTQRIRG